MASSGGKAKAPKKANLLDPHAIKHLLDESVTEVVTSKGYEEDVRLSNLRLLIGAVIIAVALFAQFYWKKFPENRDFLIICIVLYVALNVLLQIISYTKEKNAFLFTYPPATAVLLDLVALELETSLIPAIEKVQENELDLSLALAWLCLPSYRGSLICTLTIASADPKSISANKPVQLTKSITKWFTNDGILVEGLFWKEIEGLIDDYSGNRKTK